MTLFRDEVTVEVLSSRRRVTFIYLSGVISCLSRDFLLLPALVRESELEDSLLTCSGIADKSTIYITCM